MVYLKCFFLRVHPVKKTYPGYIKTQPAKATRAAHKAALRRQTPRTPTMPLCAEVQTKTLNELPRKLAESVLALAAVNKKWSKLPDDVKDIIAQSMPRETPSAKALMMAMGKPVSNGYCVRRSTTQYLRLSRNNPIVRKVVWTFMDVESQHPYTYSEQVWHTDHFEFEKRGNFTWMTDRCTNNQVRVDNRNGHTIRVSP